MAPFQEASLDNKIGMVLERPHLIDGEVAF